MTHDPDSNVFMPPAPQADDLGTDVFGYLMGEGFVMLPDRYRKFDNASAADPMPSVAGEVRVLEGLLK